MQTYLSCQEVCKHLSKHSQEFTLYSAALKQKLLSHDIVQPCTAAQDIFMLPILIAAELSVFAGNLAFPLLLVGGLFLLSRRQGGGMSGPGGNNPLNFGKSKAKFQMEPNTGITFADVAGVEEAKQDFMEVSLGYPISPPC